MYNRNDENMIKISENDCFFDVFPVAIDGFRHITINKLIMNILTNRMLIII